MFDKLKNMYDAGRIDEKYLIQAIKLGWITEEEKNTIMGIAPDFKSLRNEVGMLKVFVSPQASEPMLP